MKRLNEFDQIFTNENIIVEPNSSINISFIDNSILTLNGDSEFFINKFDNSSQEKKFHLEIVKGKFTFESGSIAKSKGDAMKIILSEIQVVLNGTLVTGENSEESKSIALVEDSMGKVGSLKVIIGDQTTEINEPSAGINISGTQIQQTTLSAEETDQVKEIKKKELVNSSTQSEEDIERALSKQLANGTIPDANGDGITDANDIEAYKNEIYDFRGERFDYLVEYSSGADMGLMSDIIMESDPSQSMYLMQSMIDYDQSNTTFLMDEVAKSGFDVFSHMAQADGLNPTMPYMDEAIDFNEVRTSIVDGMILDQSEQSIDAIARVMAVSDPSMSTYLVEEISNITPQGDENFSIDILASFTEMAPEKLGEFYEENPETMNKLTTNAFQNADKGDIEMMATIMQETSPKDTALLMTNLVENNPEIIAGVYGNLAEQDFDLFNHIESAKVQPGETVSVSVANDTMYGAEISDGSQIIDMVVDDNIIAYQDEYFQNFKGEVFAEIIAHSEGTSSEIVAELMMDTTNGDTAMFMMEAVMDENPDVLSEVMNNFADQNFDIFEHIEETTIEEENIDTDDNQSENILITDENLTTTSSATVAINETNSNSENKIRLTKAERQALKEEKIAKRKAAKIAKQEKRKIDRQAAIAERKAANRAARIAARQGNEEEIEFITTEDNLKEFKTEVFKEMIENSNESTMTTMAKLVTTTDNSTVSLIFETVIAEQNNSEENTDNVSSQNLALDFMDNLSNVDSEIVETIYETETDLVNDIVDTALSDVSSEDSEAIANIISSSGNDEIIEMVFNNIASSNDQSLTTDVFTTLAESEDGADAIITMASTNQSLYENIAKDIDPTYMTAASLYTETTSQYNTSTTAAGATTSTTDTSTYAAGDISWTTYPMSPGTISTSYYVSITGTAESMNGVTYSVSDLPDGLTLDYTTGMIFGTPTSPGIFNTTLTATDIMETGNFATASITFDIVEDTSGGYDSGDGGSFSFMSTPYPPATLTVNNTITPIYLYTSGGVGNITFTATGLPTGIYVMGDEIIGTPDTQTFSGSAVNIIATDEDGNTTSTSLTFPMVNSNSGEGGGASGPVWATYLYPPSTLTKGNEMPDMYLDATGTGFINFTASNLPMGLYVDGEYIKGTPSMQTAYTSSVMITATDDMGSQTKYVTFPQVDANGGEGSVTWTTTQADFPSTMTKGTEISSITLNATGNGAVTFTDDGNLPNGISLIAGIVSGTPQNVRATATTVTFTAEDIDGNEETLTVSFPIINAASGISNPNWITTPSTSGTYTTSSNISISAQAVSVPAANGVIYSASSLPPGVTLDTASGLISGTPTTAGTYNSEIKVEDATDSTFQIIETLTFSVTASGGVTWNTTAAEFSSLTLTEGIPMSSITLSATGNGSISYADDAMLPSGISLTAGVVSGTPTASTETETSVTFTAQDDNGDTETLTVSFPVINASEGGTVTWTTTSADFPTTLTVGDPISSISLSATGTGSINYYISSGSLPPGLTLSGGLVSGTPSTISATSTTITFTAEDDDTNTEDLVVNLPQVDASEGESETVEFDTPAGTLASVDAGETINETVTATATQGSAITYTFTATNNMNAMGLAGTSIDVTGNLISGIAPRLYVAATYSFTFTATIPNTQTNTRTFAIDISQDSSCVSPTNNICT
ncbi:putative Ig domain-containing protein [Candidatus Pelagibacter sp.]|nr:putative Ig domain-containing protein [Candidatus Pelagibacter sp.]